ncbi:HNH endonuclease [Bacillus tianshenii]|nr:HNH endonuclease [Bacillus tianshenii]
MEFQPGLEPGDILNNRELMNIFKCGVSGGMRKSNTTNSLVLVSDHTKSLYEDKWIDGLLHYTGMGQLGQQSLNYMQNKTLAESTHNGVSVFLFEVFREGQYIFMGEVQLVGQPYQTIQPDDSGELRTVWVFPLSVINGEGPINIPKKLLDEKSEYQQKQVKRLSDEELAERARHANSRGAKRRTTTTTYVRDPLVIEYAKRWADGVCQLCEKLAPFINSKGEPHLHTHHIDWLSRGGEDSIYNTVALCPNCHDKMHILDLESDVLILKGRVREYFNS